MNIFLCCTTCIFINNSYLCSVDNRKTIKRCLTAFRNAEGKKKKIMKKSSNEIFMLQYRIKRYQAMGNGAMCQTLNGRLQKLLAKASLHNHVNYTFK